MSRRRRRVAVVKKRNEVKDRRRRSHGGSRVEAVMRLRKANGIANVGDVAAIAAVRTMRTTTMVMNLQKTSAAAVITGDATTGDTRKGAEIEGAVEAVIAEAQARMVAARIAIRRCGGASPSLSSEKTRSRPMRTWQISNRWHRNASPSGI